MSAHARLKPSGSHRWGPDGCPGSPAMEEAHPEDETTDESRQGTAAHWYLAEALEARFHPVGTLAPNGWPIDVEMQHCSNDIRVDVIDTLRSVTPGCKLHIEQRVSGAATIHPDNWGTPDIYIFDAAKRVLHVWDYKYGHKYVDAFRNWQAIDYAICIFETHGLRSDVPFDHELSWHSWRITITIAQPRNYAPEGPIREWQLSGAALIEYAAKLRTAAIAASTPGAPLVTGKHCTDCTAEAFCPANQRACASGIDLSYRQSSINMPPAAVGLELRNLRGAASRIKARIDALEAHAAGLMQRGQNVPFFQMGRTNSREVWSVPDSEVIKMGKLFGAELARPAEAVTPSQARKMAVDPTVISAYSRKPSGTIKLLEVDDTAAARAFEMYWKEE